MQNLLWNLMEDESDAEGRALAELLKAHPELPDWSAAVQPVLDRLRRHNGIKKDLVCKVLSSMPFGARALPHRTVVLAESLVDWCRGHTHQMAFAVAHEASHIVRGHLRERSNVGTVTGMVTGNPLVAFGVKKLLDGGSGRENEFEADRDAVAFCHRAGYSARAGAEFLERLADGGPDPAAVKRFLGAHPPTAERVAALRAAADRLDPPVTPAPA